MRIMVMMLIVMMMVMMMCICRESASADLLHQYDGPTAFAIPGNHDWIDGLETYTRHIQHKGWLGGWLLPQVPSSKPQDLLPPLPYCILLEPAVNTHGPGVKTCLSAPNASLHVRFLE